MMIFLTILFFAISFYGIFTRSGIFSNTIKKLKEIQIKKAEGQLDDEQFIIESLRQGCLPALFAFILFVAEIIYLVNAIGVDPFKYPTVAAIMFFIITFIIEVRKDKKVTQMSNEELIVLKAKLIQNKHSLWSVLKAILWATYFGYMFYVLV